MALLLAVSSAIDIWWSYRDQEALLIRIQRVHADAAAARIADFVRGIEAQLNWMTHRAWSGSSPESRQLEALRLLRQVPPISELALIDDSGREQVKVSRLLRTRSAAASTDRRMRHISRRWPVRSTMAAFVSATDRNLTSRSRLPASAGPPAS